MVAGTPRTRVEHGQDTGRAGRLRCHRDCCGMRYIYRTFRAQLKRIGVWIGRSPYPGLYI